MGIHCFNTLYKRNSITNTYCAMSTYVSRVEVGKDFFYDLQSYMLL